MCLNRKIHGCLQESKYILFFFLIIDCRKEKTKRLMKGKCWDHQKWHNLVPQHTTWRVMIDESVSPYVPQTLLHQSQLAVWRVVHGELWHKVVPFLLVLAQLLIKWRVVVTLLIWGIKEYLWPNSCIWNNSNMVLQS